MTNRTFTTIFIIAVALRIFWITTPSLWYDENFTLILARLPFDQMLKATAGDVHPPLWYIIEWTIYHIAPNVPAWFIRVPALGFSLLACIAFYYVMYLLAIPTKVQIAALALMAVMPFQLWYAQEGRMYAMLEFFVLLTLAAALISNRLMLFIGSLALLYTQNYGPFYITAIALVIFMRDITSPETSIRSNAGSYRFLHRCFREIMPMLAAGVLWFPWLMVVQQQMSDITGRYWIMENSPGSVLVILYKLFMTASVPSEFFFASYAVTFAAVILGAVAFIQSKHPARGAISIMTITPLLIAWIISLAWQPVLLFRPLIGISPFLYLIVSWVAQPERDASTVTVLSSVTQDPSPTEGSAQ